MQTLLENMNATATVQADQTLYKAYMESCLLGTKKVGGRQFHAEKAMSKELVCVLLALRGQQKKIVIWSLKLSGVV